MDTSSALYAKAVRIVHAIEGLFEQYGELKRDHAEWIQGWVLESLDRAEFKRMAQIIFERWATPERLEGSGIPHIHKANDAIGDKIVQLARPGRLNILDLGTGTLGSVTRVLDKLERAGIGARFQGVEFTPALLTVAHDRAAQLNQQARGCRVEIVAADMHTYMRDVATASVDFITCSYAFHHLHPDDQLDLARHIYRCIVSQGAFLLADPQEGKSDFNLKVLLREEPEAVFAAFSSPEGMAERLKHAGFPAVQVLLRDDTGYTGYALAALKSDNTA
jgi:ubiquinone/menaquinone biosynthesis C-methylase UbiE